MSSKAPLQRLRAQWIEAFDDGALVRQSHSAAKRSHMDQAGSDGIDIDFDGKRRC